MDKQILKATKRDIIGRKVKNIRKAGNLPANVSGKKIKSLSVQVVADDFARIFKEAGETGIVNLEVEKEKEARPVLIHNIQVHPVTDEALHVDFLQVDLKEKVTAQVPVEVVGESPAEKQGVGTVVQQLQEVEVEALPMDLPESFEVDQSILTEVDQAIKVGDLKAGDKVEIKTDAESIIVKVEPPQKEEVVETPAPAEGEAVEGEAPAEGGDTKEEPKAEENNSDQSA